MNDDALYYNGLSEVACTNDQCNKRVSNVGQEWLAGRPGNRPIGTREVAQNTQMCLGPYATRDCEKPHTGHNTRGSRQASLHLPRPEDQSTSQLIASSSRRSPATKDCTSLATATVHLHRLPYFCGGANYDVHVWTSIVNRWLRAVRGEPSTLLTYIVSLLREAAFEWFSSIETRTGLEVAKLFLNLRKLGIP